jgi:hypothetical protein
MKQLDLSTVGGGFPPPPRVVANWPAAGNLKHRQCVQDIVDHCNTTRNVAYQLIRAVREHRIRGLRIDYRPTAFPPTR